MFKTHLTVDVNAIDHMPNLATVTTRRKKWRRRTSLARQSHDCARCKSVVCTLRLAVSGCVHRTLRKCNPIVASGGVVIDHSTVNRETRVRSLVVPGTCLDMRPDVVPLGKAFYTTFLTSSTQV
ncbi:hypothetical protein Bbelb_199200 [Branchiostoma belcheri]|nr:hypothetical protein Bbelb_199200 [Branchiostoma belcheri]